MQAPIITGRQIDFTGRKLVRGSGLSRNVLNLSGVLTHDANESGSTTDFIILLRQGGTATNKGTFVYEPTGMSNPQFQAWLKKPWVNVTAVTRDPANKEGLQASRTVALYGSGGDATSDIVYNRRGKVWSRLAETGTALLEAAVTFSWKRERYDLLEADATTGQVYIIKGLESDFNAGDRMPSFTAGRIPLYRVYVYNDTLELIPAYQWEGNAPKDPIADATMTKLRAYNQTAMASFRAKCAAGGTVRIANYTDSTGINPTAVAPYDSDPLVVAANGAGRDEPSFWAYSQQLAEFAGRYTTVSFDGRQIVQVTPGWAIVKALQALYPQTTFVYQNWGIGGTNLNTDAPNARYSTRVANMLASNPDLIITSFLMNEVGGGATTAISDRMNGLLDQLAPSNATIINLDCFALSSENANPLAWRRRLNEWNQRISRARGNAYIPFDVMLYDFPGYVGLSQQSFAAQNRWNHAQVTEYERYFAFTPYALGLTT